MICNSNDRCMTSQDIEAFSTLVCYIGHDDNNNGSFEDDIRTLLDDIKDFDEFDFMKIPESDNTKIRESYIGKYFRIMNKKKKRGSHSIYTFTFIFYEKKYREYLYAERRQKNGQQITEKRLCSSPSCVRDNVLQIQMYNFPRTKFDSGMENIPFTKGKICHDCLTNLKMGNLKIVKLKKDGSILSVLDKRYFKKNYKKKAIKYRADDTYLYYTHE